jgi:NAD(P)H dehydrogenase (quinone)
MRVLWVLAHPDGRSLNGSLRDDGVRTLREHGHAVVESDLYSMGWDPVVRAEDFAGDSAGEIVGRLDVLTASQHAYEQQRLSPDIRAEHDKIRWADTLVLQFPLWWFGPPAILKGWFDRLFVQGFAQGVKDPRTGRTLRYGNGGLAGRRAMVVTTVGAQAASTGPRGIHGDIGEVLFPLQHGTLWYTGMTVLPPVVVNGAVCLSEGGYAEAAAELRRRLLTMSSTPPIPFRRQDGGEYDERLVLCPEHVPDDSGVGVHYRGDE